MMCEWVKYPALQPYTLLILVSIFLIMVFDTGSRVINGEIWHKPHKPLNYEAP